MDINVAVFQTAILDDNFNHPVRTATPKQMADNPAAALAPLFADVKAGLAGGTLVQTTLTVSSAEPTLIRIETGIINLPFADAKKVTNFMDATASVPLNLYLVVESPYINVSKLRIDLIASADDYLADEAVNQTAVVADVIEKLAEIEVNRTTPKPAPAEKAPATRKTSTRKTTARKTTAKKTPAAKKPAAKKATTKRATATRKTTKKA